METEKSTIREGSAEILGEGNVFYNPVQQFNRDLSISVISTFVDNYQEDVAEGRIKCESDYLVTVLEALSATGLRSIRYAKEIEQIDRITANDLSKSAVDAIKENVLRNGCEEKVTVSYSDAIDLMYNCRSTRKQFTVIDLDPYGSPIGFIDAAVQSVANGGLLLITATDMAVLVGNTPETCFIKYGAIPLKMKACHEMALRILLRSIDSAANRYGRYIEPLLSISADFYIRVFVRIRTGQAECKQSACKQSFVYQCTGCDTVTLQPVCIQKANPSKSNPNQKKFALPTGPVIDTNCIHCDHRHHMAGPVWSAPIHNKVFIKQLLDRINDKYRRLETFDRMIGMLTVIEEELPDIPFYYCIEKMCSILKLEVVPILKFRSALLHAGHRVSFSHANKSSIKTDAPASVLWGILLCWARKHPINPNRLVDGSVIERIFSKTILTEYNLDDLHPNANPLSRKNALSRFPTNPTAHWGPGTRAKLMITGDKMLKSVRNQNKKKRGHDFEVDGSPDDKVGKID